MRANNIETVIHYLVVEASVYGFLLSYIYDMDAKVCSVQLELLETRD